MIRAVPLLLLFVLIDAAHSAETRPSADPAVITFSVPNSSGTPRRITLHVTIDGQSPAVRWEAFLDRLFVFYDFDENGTLNAQEASRVPPLPGLPGTKPAAVRFADLDADGDASATRREWKHYCQARGFHSVVGYTRGPTDEDRRLGELFFQTCDEDRSGGISRAEIARVNRVLRGFDLNDDDFLDRAELLGEASANATLDWKPTTDRTPSAAEIIRIDLPADLRAPIVRRVNFSFTGHGVRPGSLLHLNAFRRIAPIATSTEFLLAQYGEALADKTAIERTALEQEPLLGGLLELFPHADRNDDQRLEHGELKDYLSLIELGVSTRVGCFCIDYGRNLMSRLDLDADGRISRLEAADAPTEWNETAEVEELLVLEFGPPPIRAWGGVTVPAAKTVALVSTAVKVPAWFRAQDRNDDGVISAREFLGPPSAFSQLDADHNGVLQLEEAASADAAKTAR